MSILNRDPTRDSIRDGHGEPLNGTIPVSHIMPAGHVDPATGIFTPREARAEYTVGRIAFEPAPLGVPFELPKSVPFLTDEMMAAAVRGIGLDQSTSNVTPPPGYVKMLEGQRCRCIKSWIGRDGSKWCCKGAAEAGLVEIDQAAVEAAKLQERLAAKVADEEAKLRDHFVGQALSHAIFIAYSGEEVEGVDNDQIAATIAYDIADAMMAERARRSAR